MTREEQREDVADKFSRTKIVAGDINYIKEECFLQGALWADANRLVRVEDGLPESNRLCIVCIKDNEMDMEEEFEFDSTYRTVGGDSRFVRHENVTHWQYITLPDLPKEKQ